LNAASGCETRVEVRLADCALDLAILQRLQIGDVVRIPHPLAQPLSVRVAGDLPVFDGYLARSGTYRALELVPASA
jgi:flagellar motor switch protein FliM